MISENVAEDGKDESCPVCRGFEWVTKNVENSGFVYTNYLPCPECNKEED
jgi:hypothetical protein